MTEPTPTRVVWCCTCPVLYPATKTRPEPRKPRLADCGLTCRNCRNRLESDLRGLVYETTFYDARHDETVTVAPLYPAAYTNLLPGRSGETQAASPVFESRLPGSTDVLSMLGPGSLRLSRQAWVVPSDQHGHLPPLFLLDQWARDWCEVRGMREKPPASHIKPVVDWLLVRLDWACEHHPAVDEFARDLRGTVNHLRAVAGRLPLVHRLDAPCPSCEQTALVREDGDDRVECGGCGRRWSMDEYEWLVAVLVAEEKLRAKREAREEPAAVPAAPSTVEEK